MGYLDCETYTSTLISLSNILRIDWNILLEKIKKFSNDLDLYDINEIFKTAVKKASMQGVYIFHMTYCTDEMYNNIKKIWFKKYSSINEIYCNRYIWKNKQQIPESFDDYWSNIYDNAKNFQRLSTAPNKKLEDDGIYGLLIYDINKYESEKWEIWILMI